MCCVLWWCGDVPCLMRLWSVAMCSIIYLVCYVKVWNLNKRRGGVVKIGGGMLSFGGVNEWDVLLIAFGFSFQNEITRPCLFIFFWTTPALQFHRAFIFSPSFLFHLGTPFACIFSVSLGMLFAYSCTIFFLCIAIFLLQCVMCDVLSHPCNPWNTASLLIRRAIA